jgi:predicted outer membrane repeat protein
MRNTSKEKHPIFRLALAAFMLAGLLALTPPNPSYAAGICYVDYYASGANNGSSWPDAYKAVVGLKMALENPNCTEIWVADGVYIPGATRGSAFQLKNGVAIYGGFAGGETAREQRDPSANVTILSGNVDLNPSTDTGNAYHVVTASGTGSTAVLDGFTITDGYADGSAPDNSGGGIYMNGGSPTLGNLNIEYNTATQGGGGMYMKSSSSPAIANINFDNNTVINGDGGGMNADSYCNPTLTDVTFTNNFSGNAGGGLKVHLGNPVLTNVTFEGNTADNGGGIYSYSDMNITNAVFSLNEATLGKGGGWYIFRGDPVLNKGTFYVNSATAEGGGMYIEANTTAPTLTNVTFYGNHSDTKGGAIYSWQAAGTLSHGTFQNNSASVDGGAIYHLSFIEGALPTIRNSVFWGDSTEIKNEGTSPAVVEDSVVAGGYPGGTGIITTNPNLGLIGNYGGYAQTIPLMTGSSAIDAADDANCPATDQRGVPRPQRAGCDIGAYEVEDSTLVFTSAGKQDGWILEKAENSGKGGTKNVLGKLLYIGDDGLSRQYRAILSFNTAGIPDNAVITKVILKLKKAGVVGKVPFKVYKGLRVDIRKPRFGTRSALQPSDFQAKASKLLVGRFPAKLSSGWYVSTLNSTAYPSINLTGLTQFRVRFYKDDNNDFGADYLKLYSGNNIKARRPTLIVKYYIP